MDQRILSYFIALTLLDDEDFDFLDEMEIFWALWSSWLSRGPTILGSGDG